MTNLKIGNIVTKDNQKYQIVDIWEPEFSDEEILDGDHLNCQRIIECAIIEDGVVNINDTYDFAEWELEFEND